MRKREFIGRIVERTELPEEIVRQVLQGLRDELVESLATGYVVAFDGMGRFKTARQTRTTPSSLTGATGKTIYVTFRAAQGLKEELGELWAKTEAEFERLKRLMSTV